VNVAVTEVLPFMVRTHGAVPVQPPPDQPANDEPVDGDAVSVTPVPAGYTSVQSAPQLIPAGVLVIVPVPVPFFITVKVAWLNVATTETAAFTVTTHAPVPLHPPPDQPEKNEPVVGDAVNVTLVPARCTSEQSAPQLIPAGELVIVPVPVPFFITVKVTSSMQLTVRDSHE
jgi:hypothetical protein